MSQPGPAAYSLYDLLRTLIERVGWPSEQEKRVALESVTAAEHMQVFGNLASMMACDHPDAARTQGGRCDMCGKQIENNAFMDDRYRDHRINRGEYR